ncbi:MAG: ABC transporter ATP-binding protein/permease [Thiohalocapsa sp.]|nr:ABC transporter ATP-binding protein/permease [Thiohalocapsa sp.]
MSANIALTKSLPDPARFARTFGPYLRTQWPLIAGALAALLGGTLLRILEPWPLKLVIDRLAGYGAGDGRVHLPAVEELAPGTLIAVAAAALVLITGLRALAGYLSTVGFALAGSRALTRIRAALFRHLQSLSLDFHQRARGGDLTVRMVSDIGMLQEVAVTALLPMLGNLLILIGMFAVMFWLDPQLALIALIPLPLLAAATWHRGRRIQEAARRTRKREGSLAATASESIAAIKTIRSLSLAGHFADAFGSQNSASLRDGVRTKRLSAGLERGVDVLIALATALVLWLGAERVLARVLTPGELLVFLAYLKSAFRPVRDFAKYAARLAKASAAGERVLDLFTQQPDVRDLPGAVAAPALTGHVRFEHVHFSYPDSAGALRDIDLGIDPGTHVAVVGPSGSGKSTLVSLLLRLYDPRAGRLLIDGRDIRHFTQDSLRARISLLPQDTLLFATTVRENIAFGAAGVSDAEIEAAARLANAHDFIEALPESYDTVLAERGATLSNGQRQRIAIARAAVRNSPILILDEPTTGLDRESETLVMQAIARLARGRTTLHVTHRIDAARDADRILFVEHGRVVEDGDHDTLLRLNGRYAAFWHSHRRAEASFGEVQHVAGF